MARKTEKTPLQPMIFDTDVLIWYFRGNHKAQSFLASIPQEVRWVSSLTVMELLQGCHDRREITEVEAFMAENISRIIHPKTSISEKAIHLVQTFALSHGLRAVDSLIAASALLHRAVLATGNKRHFSFIPGLKTLTFFP